MSEPLRFTGWRRKRGSKDPWERVPDMEGDSPFKVYRALMELELTAVDALWEYAVMPAEQKPAQYPEQRRSYHTRRLTPGA